MSFKECYKVSQHRTGTTTLQVTLLHTCDICTNFGFARILHYSYSSMNKSSSYTSRIRIGVPTTFSPSFRFVNRSALSTLVGEGRQYEGARSSKPTISDFDRNTKIATFLKTYYNLRLG